MYDAGCTNVAYGVETGSEKMLAVMEKAVTLADNYKIAKLTPQANLYYVPQLVVGMPGETEETVEETNLFLKTVYMEDPFVHPAALQVNYAQALPGTPLYESGRIKGLIEPGVDGEEVYLFKVSDKNARDLDDTVNHTEVPHLIWRSWANQIKACANYAYIQKFSLKEFELWNRVHCEEDGTAVRDEAGATYLCNSRAITNIQGSFEDVKAAIKQMDKDYRSGKLQGATEIRNRMLRYPRLIYHLRGLFPIYFGIKELRMNGVAVAANYFAEYFVHQMRKFTRSLAVKEVPEAEHVISLRKEVKEASERLDSDQMAPLRAGR